MSQPGYVVGLPGVRTALVSTPRIIMRQGMYTPLSGGRIIDGSESRDPSNTGDLGVLRAGLLMGRDSSSGLYAPCFIGVLQSAYTSGGTSITVTAAQAVELERLVGQSGSSELVAIGAPTATGTVAVTAVSHSAINTTTGVLTISDMGVDKTAGTFIGINSNTKYIPRTFIPDGTGIKVLDIDGTTSVDVPFAMPISGMILTANILPGWPAAANTTLQNYIRDNLRLNGVFTFDDLV